jgi:hypothetical protein
VRSEKTREEKLFGAACLKVTLEQSGQSAEGNEIYRGALSDLDLSDGDVDAYLGTHRAQVVAAIAARRPMKR